MVDIFDLTPLMEMNCFRSVKYDSKHLFDINESVSKRVGSREMQTLIPSID